ncbi:MAG: DEAD/DEAH box helicase, partial [Pseudonocardia sp.]
KNPTHSGADADPATGSGHDPGGPSGKPDTASKATSKHHDGTKPNKDPPPDDVPTRRELKQKLAKAQQAPPGTPEDRPGKWERLNSELDKTTDRKRRAELLDARDKMAETKRHKIEEIENELNLERWLREHGGVRTQLREILRTWRDHRNNPPLENWKHRDGLTRTDYFVLVLEQIRQRHGVTLRNSQIVAAILMLDHGLRGFRVRDPLRGVVVELATGEGKTNAAMLAAWARVMEDHAMKGAGRQGVHVMTHSTPLARDAVNDYRPVAEGLGLTVRLLDEQFVSPRQRRRAYQAHVTIGSASEFVFDFLRDQKAGPAERVQGGRGFALVDEADMVLLDWGGSPHKLAEAIDAAARDREVYWARDQALRLRKTEFGVDRHGLVTISKKQRARISERLGTVLTDQQVADLVNARRAMRLRLNEDYKIAYGSEISQIEILDNLNGRALAGRRWSSGLHEAVEAKHGLPVGHAQRTIAETTMAKYLDTYSTVAGMTGTAIMGRAPHLFRKLYHLGVEKVERHNPDRLHTDPPVVYATEAAQLAALAKKIKARHWTQDPAPELVIFRTPAAAETFAAMLSSNGVHVRVLNALDHRSGITYEDAVVAAAGRPHTVTVATNIIGRGADIKLGAGHEAAKKVVIEAGGLKVTMGSLFESPRATRQGFGRAGRQGEPGRARQVLSLDDPLLGLTAWEREQLARLADKNGVIPAKLANKLVKKAKKRTEKAAARQLEGVVTGKTAPETEIVHTTDGAALGTRTRTGAGAADDPRVQRARERVRERAAGLRSARERADTAAHDQLDGIPGDPLRQATTG